METSNVDDAFNQWSVAHQKYVVARSALEDRKRDFRLGFGAPPSNAEADHVEMLRLHADTLLRAFLQLCDSQVRRRSVPYA